MNTPKRGQTAQGAADEAAFASELAHLVLSHEGKVRPGAMFRVLFGMTKRFMRFADDT